MSERFNINKYFNGHGLSRYVDIPDPLNPYNLRPNTMRLVYNDGATPTAYVGSFKHIQEIPNIWDYNYESNDWSGALQLDPTSPWENRPYILEVLGANTKHVTGMKQLFWMQSELSAVNIFDTNKVTTMEKTFGHCGNLVDVALLDTSNVTSTKGMFEECIFKLSAVPTFDTSKVVDMDSMFLACDALEEIPQFNTSSVVSMTDMFGGCSSLITIPLLDTRKVSSMQSMFAGCESLSSIPNISTSACSEFGWMFAGCKSLVKAPDIDFNQNDATCYEMFSDCTSLSSLPKYDFSKVHSYIDFGGFCWNCSSLSAIPDFEFADGVQGQVVGGFYNCVNVQSGALNLYNKLKGSFGHDYRTFEDCGKNNSSGLADLYQIPTAWGGLSGTNNSNTGNNPNTGSNTGNGGGSNTGDNGSGNGSYTGVLN